MKFVNLKRTLLGAPRDFTDPNTYHNISLIALLAWIGLGADGLSSSSYGPDEAFQALGQHTYLAIGLALATAVTVLVISLAYSRIIEHFPYGGGGYVVASKLLGPGCGVLSGSALLVDYILTVSVSIACCVNQLFNVLPAAYLPYKLVIEAIIISILVMLNLRGAKESIMVMAPIFAIFLITHVILIFGGIGTHLGQAPRLAQELHTGFNSGLGKLGLMGMFALFLRAYSMGAGTFTGIEAVSNGLQIMREPKVQTGKRTMVYMAISLSLTAAGILICYLLFQIKPIEGRTMNGLLLEAFAGHWRLGGINIGHGYVVLTLAAEAALLFVAAQAGFIDGPRVMANMAQDGWLPRRFSQLSDRLTMQDGVLLMGGAALAVLFYTRGSITALVTMYSINVFLTFSLSMTGMCRYWIKERKTQPAWKRELAIQFVGLILCASILATVIIEKFEQGAWMTLVVTAVLVTVCFLIRRHYHSVREQIRQFDDILKALPASDADEAIKAVNPKLPTAVMLVSSFSGLGVHQLLQVHRLFPGQFKNFLFLSVGVIDSATMKGASEVDRVRERTEQTLKQYVELAHRLGFAADSRMDIGTEAVLVSDRLCRNVAREFPRPIFFLGKLLFQDERWYHRFLHNETAYQLQRQLHFAGLNAVVLTARLLNRNEPTDRGETLPINEASVAVEPGVN